MLLFDGVKIESCEYRGKQFLILLLVLFQEFRKVNEIFYYKIKSQGILIYLGVDLVLEFFFILRVMINIILDKYYNKL